MLNKSKVEEVLYTPMKNIDDYLIGVVKRNLGLNTVILDYRFSEDLQEFWKKINPLLNEVHMNRHSYADPKKAENEKSIKFFTHTESSQILRRLLMLSDLKNPIQHKELFTAFLNQKLALQSESKEPLTFQDILDWRDEIERMQDNEKKQKLLPSILQTVYGLSSVFKHLDKQSTLEIDKILEKGESLYITTGMMGKAITTVGLGNLFLIDILNWIESREFNTKPSLSIPYVVVVEYEVLDKTIITELKRCAVRSGVQLVLTS